MLYSVQTIVNMLEPQSITSQPLLQTPELHITLQHVQCFTLYLPLTLVTPLELEKNTLVPSFSWGENWGRREPSCPHHSLVKHQRSWGWTLGLQLEVFVFLLHSQCQWCQRTHVATMNWAWWRRMQMSMITANKEWALTPSQALPYCPCLHL